jgi:beta-phosphoglucomutase-like phosphatase (HAD superfamily)
MTDLIIFDCDGVLVETEAIANERMAEIFTDMGLPMSGRRCRELFQGRTMEDVCSKFAEMAGIEPDPALPAVIRREVELTLSAGVRPVPGIGELLTFLDEKTIPYCVASSGSISKMHMTLGQSGLLDRLQHLLFSAQDIGRGKPHPDVFLHAAEAMGHSCANAVIIEDSLSGVLAGVSAGARVLGYCGDPFTDAGDLQAAGAETFHAMDDVPRILAI